MSNEFPSDLELGPTLRGLSPGQQVFGRYKLERVLGRGGMGIVWLAHDEDLGRDVALKFLPDLVVHDRFALDQLKRETNRNLDLTHPNIVRVYYFLHDGNSAAISMEFVDGDNLSDLRVERTNRYFEVAELEPLVVQLCDALAFAHERAKIAHRDLKPANLMLNRSGDLKVADFGIASTLSETVSRVSLRPTSGTLVYMSPQQLDGEPPSALDDIYSLGATLYDLLTGKPVFYAGNIDRQIHEKLAPTIAERRAQLDVAGAEVPRAWEQVIASCLSKSVADRPQSVSEIAQRLGLSGVGSKAIERPLRKKDDSADRSTRRLFISSLAAIAIVVVAVGAWWFARKETFSPPAKRLVAKAEQSPSPSELEKYLVMGRYAMARRQWPTAQEAYAKALEISPSNAEARESSKAIRDQIANARGALTATSDPSGARVFLLSDQSAERRYLGETPLTRLDLPVGIGQLVFEKDGYESARKGVEIREEKTAEIHLVTLQSRLTPPPMTTPSPSPVATPERTNSATVAVAEVSDPEKGIGASTLWNHNGSTLVLLKNGEQRSFVYKQVKSDMRRNVATGAVLFEGTADSGHYTGKAHRFKKGLPPIAYPVEGRLLNTGRVIELQGVAPKRNDQGVVTEYVPEVLRFEYIGPSE